MTFLPGLDFLNSSDEPMGTNSLIFTIVCLLCSMLGIYGIMKMPFKSPPVLVMCALSCCCSSSQTTLLANDIKKRVA